jgi:23S rRNA (cytosine1962-C5)-methyltransferase
MDADLFLAIVQDAAEDVGRKIRQVEYRTQAKDHPILLSAPETKYLKFLIVQVLD